ncbi:MAG: hypothetical protein F4190_13695 [Acidimicrobiales bacterium]|nr:hypothetical protein [Acidimicrobiales bacterium]MYG89557.1 hypothetical protein [Acidimicrobiales bacterium]MYI27293.1 hypothetical protein [Acidimicrobiales bacterium]
MGVRGDRTRILRQQRWLLVGMACLVVSLLPLPAVGAAEHSAAGADDSASDAEPQSEAAPDDSVGGVEVVRYASSDQYELSLAVAQALADADGGTSERVVLVSGESWADAVTTGPLAASLGAPVVLVPPGGLQTATARPDLVEFLRSSGVRRVVIVGSPDVLPNHEPSVLFGLGMLPRNIERVHGDDPIGIAVAERIDAPAELGELGRTAIIANDQSVADSVAVGPLAAAGPFPLLLTAPDALDARIVEYLADQEFEHVVLVGGTAAIAPTVQEVIEAAGATVTRLAGRDRRDTARLAADLFKQHIADDSACEGSPIRIGLAPAQHPEQALTAGPLLARRCAPLRYTEPDQLSADLHNTLYLASHRPEVAHVATFAAEDQIPDDILEPAVPPTKFAAFQVHSNPETGDLEAELVIINEDGQRRTYENTREILFTTAKRLSTIRAAPRRFLTMPRHLSWSPDGTRLAYFGPQADVLYVLDTQNGDLHQVEFADYEFDLMPIQPQWSPDSSKLAFSATIEDKQTLDRNWASVWSDVLRFTSELFIYDADSNRTVRATMDAKDDLVGAWSPDGTKILHFGNPSNRYCVGNNQWLGLFVYDLALAESRPIYSSVQCFLDTDTGVYRSVWSPDGTRIAFAANPLHEDSWQNELFVADAADSEATQLSPENCPLCDDKRHPRYDGIIWVHGWSPDGKKLLYGTSGLQMVHDFTLNLAEALTPYIPYLEAPRQDLLGWLPDDETPLFVQDNCLAYTRGDRYLRIARLTSDDSASVTVLDLPPPEADEPHYCRFSIAQSTDRRHIAVSYPDSGIEISKLSDRQLSKLVTFATYAQRDESTPSESCISGYSDAPTLDWGEAGVLGSCPYLLSSHG